jgi:hypothetical protein
MKHVLLILFLFASLLHAAEETGFSWPLGPMGGKMRLWTGESFVRVSELTNGAPGKVEGLRVNDFILGAFGRDFEVLGSDFEGVVRQLGNAIEHAESNDGVLPLKVLRSGAGIITVTVNLPVLGALDPSYPLTSAKYAATYEYACAQLHSRVMADGDGDLGYPTGFVALSLLGHPNWNDLTGAKPYRLSINKLRDWAIGMINNGQLTPVEDKYFDGTANPNYVGTGLENWSLGQAVMFLSEYVSKTGEQATYQTVLQRGAVMMANRIENWAQPANGGTADLSYATTRGATGHGGVTGDYTHQWYVGINMAGLHLFNGLALAKRAGADMTQRPKDGHYFGHTLNPGDAVPSNISPALPATIILPRGAQDSRVLPHIDNVSAAPLTKIITANASNNPFYYDVSLDQKFWIQWDCLTRSTGSSGYVAYASVTGAEYDAGGRTPATLLGMKVYHGSTPPSSADQAVMDMHTNYIIAAHNRHLNAHAYNMGGGLFTALVMPWFSDRDQRYFWDNWKFYANFMRQPDGSVQYFRGRSFDDAYQDYSLVALVNNALPRSVALGGLPHVPGYDTNRVFARFKKPLLEWPTPAARKRRITGNSEVFTVELVDASGAVIAPAQVTAAWSVVSGPVTSGIFSNAATLNTTATFPQAGTYRLKLDASANSLSTSELIDIEVMPSVSASYAAGEADYKVYTGISGTTVASLTSAPGYPGNATQSSVLTTLEGTYSGNNYGATLTTTIVAPETGTYRFYIASDDESSLRFNASGPSASGAVQIASVPGWTDQYQWNKYAAQQSAAITLTAGQQYYLQALHKEGSGGDHLAVAWTTPSNATITVIAAPYIARELPVAASPGILTQPQPVVANLGDNVSLTFTTSGSDLSLYQWRLNGTNFGAPQTTPTLTLNNIGARLAGSWDCVFTDGSTVLTTDAVTVTINGIGIVTNGGLWQEVFTSVIGGTIDSLLAHSSYPLLSSSSSVLTEPRTTTFGDDYGQRWTGWLIPSTSGRYRFYAAADDLTRLYLSPTEYESHKQLIHSITSYTGEMSWSSRTPSAWITLEAGKRYYVEFLHTEGGGGDHAAFTWQKEGDPVPANGAGLIPSGNLQYITGGNAPDASTAPPFAVADMMNVETAAPATLDVLANDLDASNATLVITAVTQPANGSVSFSGRTVTYTSNAGFGGSDSFTYTVRNGLNLTATATVNVTVASPWNGLLAWWRFNENTGTTAGDSTGNGHTATLTSGTTWTPGRAGSGIYIASSTQMAATATGKPIPAAFTISAWMNPTNTSGVDTIFSFGSTAAFRTNGSRLRFTTFGVLDHDTNTGMFSGGTWTHVAVTFTPGVADGAKFYVNGVLRQSMTSSALSTPTGVWRIGASHISGEWFGGALDDVRLYNRVLSDADIALIAAAPTPWQEWRADHFTPTNLANLSLSGSTPDPDKDGIENLMEYALGLNPNTPAPLSQRITNDLDSNQYLRLTITKNPNATDVTYSVEASSDLTTWNTTEVLILQNTATVLQVRDTQAMSAANRRFMRLRVTQP